MRLTSPAFEDGSRLGPRFARDGDDLNPPLHFLDIPEGTASLLLIMEDIDSPLGPFTHWVVWNIDPRISCIEEGRLPGSCEVGLNGFGTLGYAGPCPPSGRHRYRFRLCALGDRIDVSEGGRKDQVLGDAAGFVIAEAELTGTVDAFDCR